MFLGGENLLATLYDTSALVFACVMGLGGIFAAYMDGIPCHVALLFMYYCIHSYFELTLYILNLSFSHFMCFCHLSFLKNNSL